MSSKIHLSRWNQLNNKVHVELSYLTNKEEIEFKRLSKILNKKSSIKLGFSIRDESDRILRNPFMD